MVLGLVLEVRFCHVLGVVLRGVDRLVLRLRVVLGFVLRLGNVLWCVLGCGDVLGLVLRVVLRGVLWYVLHLSIVECVGDVLRHDLGVVLRVVDGLVLCLVDGVGHDLFSVDGVNYRHLRCNGIIRHVMEVEQCFGLKTGTDTNEVQQY